MQRIAIFGGTSDPIHNGHLNISFNIQKAFNFNTYIFLPCKTPILKSPTLATSTQRIKMIELALKNLPHFTIDQREINRGTPSYMVETLKNLRKEYPNASITLVIGYDTSLSLPQWHEWEHLITLTHLLVIERREFHEKIRNNKLNDVLKKYKNKNKKTILNTESGSILFFKAGDYPISSSQIRRAIQKGIDIKEQLSSSVYQYIKDQKLYQ